MNEINQIETGALNTGRNKFHSVSGQVATPMAASRRTFYVLDARQDENEALGFRVSVYKLMHMIANTPMSRSNGRACWVATNADDGVQYVEGMTTNQIVASVRNSNANAMEFLDSGFNGLSIQNGKLANFPVPVGPAFGAEWYEKANGLALKALSLYKGYEALLSGSAFISHDKSIVTANEKNGERVAYNEQQLSEMMAKIVAGYKAEIKRLVEAGAIATSTVIYVGANGLSPCIVPIAAASYKTTSNGKQIDVRTTPRAYGRIAPNFCLTITGQAEMTTLEQDELHEGYLAGVQVTEGTNPTQYCRKFVNFKDSRGNDVTVRAVMYSNGNNGRGQTRAEAFDFVSSNADEIMFTENNVLGFESRTPREDDENGQPWVVTARVTMDGYIINRNETGSVTVAADVDLDSLDVDGLDLGEVDIFADTAKVEAEKPAQAAETKRPRRGQAQPAETKPEAEDEDGPF
jgi:hypothetical protein|nr:MAG TPA: hypothetical protein [Bacteriophage sp.]